jgi:hypothetical protein
MFTKYIEKAQEEIKIKKFAVTRQYLEVNSVSCKDGIAQVGRIDTEREKDSICIYFPIENQEYYLAIYFDKNDDPEVRWVGIEAGNRIYFRATSEKLTFNELAAKTTLQPLQGWSKGDKNGRNNEHYYKFSSLTFDPFPNEAYELEHKLSLLLNELEKDTQGIKDLVLNANGYIQIVSYRYVSNFGGIHLDIKTINILNSLGLELDFDIYVDGIPLSEDSE